MSKHPGGPKKRRAAWSSIFALVLCATSLGQQNDSSLVITYEGDRYPEQVGWERVLQHLAGLLSMKTGSDSKMIVRFR